MARWLVWSQVGFAIIGFMASFADSRGLIRPSFPLYLGVTLSSWSIFIVPPLVFWLGKGRQEVPGLSVAFITSIGLAAVTFLALMPLMQ